MGIEEPKNIEEIKQEEQNQETKDSLLNFGKGDEKNDDKLLKDPNGGNKIIKSMKEDIIKKHNEINDPNSKEKIENLTKSLDGYTKLGKLNREQAKELSEIYNQIVSIESTEHAEDTKSGEEASKSMYTKKQEYINKLDEATERLKNLLESHDKQEQEKIRNQMNKSALARKQQQEPPSAYTSLEVPHSIEKSPTALA